MVGVAVKVTEVPAQTGPCGTAEILTLAAKSGFTVTVITLDVAGLPVTQVAVDNICTVIWAPFTRPDDV